MGKRAVVVGALAVLAVLVLSGCQVVKPGTFVRAQARADAASWTHEAEKSVGSPTATTRADGYETCRTDTGYFATTFQWRTITNLRVPQPRQSRAMAAIASAFTHDGWVATGSTKAVTIVGPHGSAHRGVIRVEPGGGSQLAVSVISPCYH